jgi:hypothetical protein
VLRCRRGLLRRQRDLLPPLGHQHLAQFASFLVFTFFAGFVAHHARALARFVALHARALARFLALHARALAGEFAPLARALLRNRLRFGFSANCRAGRGSPLCGFIQRSHVRG